VIANVRGKLPRTPGIFDVDASNCYNAIGDSPDGQMIQSSQVRTAALRAGMRIETLTVLWMMLDSVIELLSAAVLLWRLHTETQSNDLARVEQIERRATWVSAVLLALLCLYVLTTIVLGLVRRVEPANSYPGILLSIGALIVMPLLARAKRQINATLDSASLRADIAESVTCAYMAGTVLLGLGFNAALGWWWAEYVAAAVFLYWLTSETREAFEAATTGEPVE